MLDHFEPAGLNVEMLRTIDIELRDAAEAQREECAEETTNLLVSARIIVTNLTTSVSESLVQLIGKRKAALDPQAMNSEC